MFLAGQSHASLRLLSLSLGLPHNPCVCVCVCVCVWERERERERGRDRETESNRLMLFTCLVPRLRGHSDPCIVTSSTHQPNPQSAESVLFPLLLSSGGQHQYLLFCASESYLLISYISSLPQPPFQSQLGPRGENREQEPRIWESLNHPIMRGARPHVFTLHKFSLRLQLKALLAEPSFADLAKDLSLSLACLCQCLPGIWISLSLGDSIWSHSKWNTFWLFSPFALTTVTVLCLVAQLCPTLCHPRLLCPWGFSRQEYWSGLPCPPPGVFQTQRYNPGLLQGLFPTQRSNPGLPHCRWIIYHLSHQGSPRILEWVAHPFSRGSSRPRNQTRVSCIAGRFFTSWATQEAQQLQLHNNNSHFLASM